MTKNTYVMTYTGDIDSFNKSVENLNFKDFIIIDNSINKSVYKYKSGFKDVIKTPMRITCSQCFNMAQDLARENNSDVLIMAHSDIFINNRDKYVKFLNYIDDLKNDKSIKWGCCFTTYDSLAAFNMDCCDVIGPWDQNITHYPIDVDYYYRMRKYGYETLNFGGDWIEHSASITLRKDMLYRYYNEIYHNGNNNRYYELKWGGKRDQESFLFPFNGKDFGMQYLEMVSNGLYQQLLNTFSSSEGAFLYDQSEIGRNAQFSLILNILNACKPKVILETGTHKGLFTYFLSHFISGFKIYTFDNNENSSKAINLLKGINYIDINFTLGNTIDTFPKFLSEHDKNEVIDLAWVDASHEYETCLSDIECCMKLEIPYILIDDYKWANGIKNAVSEALKSNDKYYWIQNPYYEWDSRGIVILRKKRENILSKKGKK